MLAELPSYESATGIKPDNGSETLSESETPDINLDIPTEENVPLDEKKLKVKRARCLFMLFVDFVVITFYLTSFVHEKFTPPMLINTMGLVLIWSFVVASIFIPSIRIKLCAIYRVYFLKF